MNCPACQTDLPEEARFCGACGYRLDEKPAYPAAPPPEEARPPIVLMTRKHRVARPPEEAPAPEPIAAAEPAREPAQEAARPPQEAPAPEPVPDGEPIPLRRRKTRPPAAAEPVLEPGPAQEAVPISQRKTAQVERAPARSGPLVMQPTGRSETKAVEIRRPSPDEVRARHHHPMREVRSHERFALSVEVTLGSEHNFYTGFAENISDGGLFVATYDIHPVGTRFDMTFTLPELDRSCTVLCEVKWVREHNASTDMPPGMGLAFLSIHPADQQAVEVFARHREPLFFD